MSQYSNLTAAFRAALAVWRTAPIAARAASVLGLASCAGPIGIVPNDGQALTSPVDGSASNTDTGAPESSGGDSVDSAAAEAGTPDAAVDTAVAAETGPSAEDAGSFPDGNPPDAMPFPPACLPMPNTDTLPFAVDDQYAASGYEGDAVNASAITMYGDTTCGGNRSSKGALGACHTVLYTPLSQGQSISGNMTAVGWAGVAWQYPADNWGTSPGYAIPPGAKSVMFSARGAAGGEVVSFWVGGTGVGTAANPDAPCSDPLSARIGVTLTSTWTRHAIPLDGSYAPAVLTGFGFTLAKSDQPSLLQAQAITFYVDDIRWQM